MTAWVPVGLDTPNPDTSAITFVVSPETLTTVRYADPMAFRVLRDQVRRQCSTPAEQRRRVSSPGGTHRRPHRRQPAERLRPTCATSPATSSAWTPARRAPGIECDLNEVIKLLGRRNALVANLRECLVSIARMLQFFLNNAATWMKGELAAQFRSVARDVKSLDDYTNQQTQEMTFLLESTLGLINIQQNQIIKIFTVASVLFMPPTLIASIYGMNFEHMPELSQPWAYPVVILVLVFSAILPIVWFKKKKLL